MQSADVDLEHVVLVPNIGHRKGCGAFGVEPMHTACWLDGASVVRVAVMPHDELREQIVALTNNIERAVAILTPLFVKAQEADHPDEGPIGGALDVLTGWFGQTGKPLRRLDELQQENSVLRSMLSQDNPCIHEQIAQAKEAFARGDSITLEELDAELSQ